MQMQVIRQVLEVVFNNIKTFFTRKIKTQVEIMQTIHQLNSQSHYDPQHCRNGSGETAKLNFSRCSRNVTNGADDAVTVLSFSRRALLAAGCGSCAQRPQFTDRFRIIRVGHLIPH
jgi:hypothetical protein